MDSTTRHGSCGQQEQLESDRPLQRGDRRLFLVRVRHDAAAGFEFDVDVHPLAPAALRQQVFDRAVGRQRRRGPEHDLPDVAADFPVRVDVLDQLPRAETATRRLESRNTRETAGA